jgi:hypothetical protein
MNELERTFSQLNVSENSDNHNKEVEAVFDQSYLSVKIRSILSHLDSIIEKREKW